MQDLIVGRRYSVAHPEGLWEGECTFLKTYVKDFIISDVEVTKGNPSVQNYFSGSKSYKLNAQLEWSWEEINICLENK